MFGTASRIHCMMRGRSLTKEEIRETPASTILGIFSSRVSMMPITTVTTASRTVVRMLGRLVTIEESSCSPVSIRRGIASVSVPTRVLMICGRQVSRVEITPEMICGIISAIRRMISGSSSTTAETTCITAFKRVGSAEVSAPIRF